ncbi:MAG: hypothetical protein RRZ24_08945 [Clostridia bacterium]
MKQWQNDSINFYEGYRRQIKRRKSSGQKRQVLVFLPLMVIAGLMLISAGVLLVNNMYKTQRIYQISERISAIQSDYLAAQSLSLQYEESVALNDRLAVENAQFNLHPLLTRALFTDVRTCAGNIFEINHYFYDEANGTLVIDANAASVNEVPKLVERLRGTGLFSSVQYTGYTSDSTQRYYCTVGCTLQNQDTME